MPTLVYALRRVATLAGAALSLALLAPPAEFAALIRSDRAKWAGVVKKSGMQIE